MNKIFVSKTLITSVGLVSIFIAIAFVLLPHYSLAQTSTSTPALQDTQTLIKQLQSLILSLQVQINDLKAKLEATQKDVEIVKSEIQFTKSLARGTEGDEVKSLQEALKQDPEIYPEGLVTGFFGPATEAAVKRFQEKHHIESLGIIGPRTRAKLNELITQGAGKSGVIPSGLERRFGTITPLQVPPLTTPSGTIPAQSIGQTGITTVLAVPAISATTTAITPFVIGSSSQITATATPLATIPAVFPTPLASVTPTASAAPAVQTQTTVTPTTASSTVTTTASATYPIFTVTSPNGTEQWTAGNTYAITWTSSGKSVSAVNIELYKSGSYSVNIAYEVSNNGSMNWTVPSTITAGSDYKIRVYNNMYYINFDESNSAFSIIVPVTAPATAPISYWKFDGNGNNEIAGKPNAVIVGNAAFNPSGGKFDGYLYVPTGSDWAKIPYNSMFDLPGPFTIEFWFRQRADQSFLQDLVYKGNGINNYNFRIFRQLWNQYNFGPVIMGSTAVNTGYWSSPTNSNQLPHGTWHHVIYTRGISEAVSYLDGATLYTLNFTQSPEYSGSVKTPALDIIIGDSAVDTDIDNLRIYNYALTRGEVLYNWQNTPTGGATASPSPSVLPSPTPSLTPTPAPTPSPTPNPASITMVTRPAGGETWTYLNYVIQYKASGVSRFGFKLLRGAQVVYETPSAFSVDVPLSYPLNPPYIAPLSIVSGTEYKIEFPLNPSFVSITSGSDYKIRVFDWDNPGIYVDSNVFSFDVTPPAVSLASASSIAANSAVITWTTDEPGTGSVNYGSAAQNWAITPTNTSYTTSHSFTLSNLTSGTLYTFRVYSSDALGNSFPGLPPSYTFTTATTTTRQQPTRDSLLASLSA
ncbi:MAG: LamG-like jellyroll fold domain-containing protein, partial [Candidatus Sungbacteria bacterium]|nr:LamG-like jellyroll fold domain-containing protein [Candidatus Sungbacteria bacterium]